MADFWTFWAELAGRLTGPMHLRVYLQPTVAAILAIKDGIKDAHEGRSPYFWTIFTHPEVRRQLLKEGWKTDGRVITMGAIMDAVYQFTVLHAVRPVELIVVVVLLAWVPYLMIRGTVNRIVRWRESRKVGA